MEKDKTTFEEHLKDLDNTISKCDEILGKKKSENPFEGLFPSDGESYLEREKSIKETFIK